MEFSFLCNTVLSPSARDPLCLTSASVKDPSERYSPSLYLKSSIPSGKKEWALQVTVSDSTAVGMSIKHCTASSAGRAKKHTTGFL